MREWSLVSVFERAGGQPVKSHGRTLMKRQFLAGVLNAGRAYVYKGTLVLKDGFEEQP